MTSNVRGAIDRKKQLGQYFTPQHVGRLLALLADAPNARTIVDPMVGVGDLLKACIDVGAAALITGRDLDPLAVAQAQALFEGLASTDITQGDAFSTSFSQTQFDLVIANPPYIRYQTKGNVDGINVPGGSQVRAGLIEAIEQRSGLTSQERDVFLNAAHTYPGTADIAVPAWILCASMVRTGGTLALVVPRAWLSREYAHAVRELLDTAFDVNFIIEDGDASWFDDAQIRTQLVVARRRAVTSPPSGRPVVVARATRELESDGKLRGDLDSDSAVAEALRAAAALIPGSQPVTITRGLTAQTVGRLSVADSVRAEVIPDRLAVALGVPTDHLRTRTLLSYGWSIGQGLRTGANDFFYVDVSDEGIHPSARWNQPTLDVPQECLRPVIRRQSQLTESYGVDIDALTTRVLTLRGWVTDEDSRLAADASMRIIPPGLAGWITRVSRTPLSTRNNTPFADLSAVRTNARHDAQGRPKSFWYQLPAFAPRHRPILFVPRVCGARPTAFFNLSGGVVDANFSTLWPSSDDAIAPEAVLALLNSSWAWASLEASCAVLGGGALKVEATDLRRLALPELSPRDLEHLHRLGVKLITGDSSAALASIDELMSRRLGTTLTTDDQMETIRGFAALSASRRSMK